MKEKDKSEKEKQEHEIEKDMNMSVQEVLNNKIDVISSTIEDACNVYFKVLSSMNKHDKKLSELIIKKIKMWSRL